MNYDIVQLKIDIYHGKQHSFGVSNPVFVLFGSYTTTQNTAYDIS